MERESASRSGPVRWAGRLGLVCGALVLALALLAAPGASFTQDLIAHPAGDGFKHLWTLWWFRGEVWAGRLPLGTEHLNFPEGLALYPVEALNGLLASALVGASVVTAANLAAALNLALDGVMGAWLGWEVSRRRWGALGAGVALMGCDFARHAVDVGVGELQHLWWQPLGMVLWLRLWRSGRWRDAAALGIALAGAMVTAFYHGFVLALLLLVASTAALITAPRRGARSLRLAAAAAAAMAMALPFIWLFATGYESLNAPGVDVGDPVHSRLAPPQLVGVGSSMGVYEGGRFLGGIALGGGLLGIALGGRRGRIWALGLAACVLLAMGSRLTWDGDQDATLAGYTFRLPFSTLNELLRAWIEPINFPARLASGAATCLAALIALAAPRRLPWLPLALALAATADVRRHRGPPTAVTPDTFPLLEGALDGPALDVSFQMTMSPRQRRASIAAQVAHGQPVQHVPMERVEFWGTQGNAVWAALPLKDHLSDGWTGKIMGGYDGLERDLALLYDAGFRWLLVLGGPETEHAFAEQLTVPPRLRQGMERMLGPPDIEGAAQVAWRIPPIPETDALPDWRAWHARRIEVLQADPASWMIVQEGRSSPDGTLVSNGPMRRHHGPTQEGWRAIFPDHQGAWTRVTLQLEEEAGGPITSDILHRNEGGQWRHYAREPLGARDAQGRLTIWLPRDGEPIRLELFAADAEGGAPLAALDLGPLDTDATTIDLRL